MGAGGSGTWVIVGERTLPSATPLLTLIHYKRLQGRHDTLQAWTSQQLHICSASRSPPTHYRPSDCHSSDPIDSSDPDCCWPAIGYRASPTYTPTCWAAIGPPPHVPLPVGHVLLMLQDVPTHLNCSYPHVGCHWVCPIFSLSTDSAMEMHLSPHPPHLLLSAASGHP